jgi:hypothetical protein
MEKQTFKRKIAQMTEQEVLELCRSMGEAGLKWDTLCLKEDSTNESPLAALLDFSDKDKHKMFWTVVDRFQLNPVAPAYKSGITCLMRSVKKDICLEWTEEWVRRGLPMWRDSPRPKELPKALHTHVIFDALESGENNTKTLLLLSKESSVWLQRDCRDSRGAHSLRSYAAEKLLEVMMNGRKNMHNLSALFPREKWSETCKVLFAQVGGDTTQSLATKISQILAGGSSNKKVTKWIRTDVISGLTESQRNTAWFKLSQRMGHQGFLRSFEGETIRWFLETMRVQKQKSAHLASAKENWIDIVTQSKERLSGNEASLVEVLNVVSDFAEWRWMCLDRVGFALIPDNKTIQEHHQELLKQNATNLEAIAIQAFNIDGIHFTAQSRENWKKPGVSEFWAKAMREELSRSEKSSFELGQMSDGGLLRARPLIDSMMELGAIAPEKMRAHINERVSRKGSRDPLPGYEKWLPVIEQKILKSEISGKTKPIKRSAL